MICIKTVIEEERSTYIYFLYVAVKHYVTVCRFQAGDDDGSYIDFIVKKYIMNGGETMKKR